MKRLFFLSILPLCMLACSSSKEDGGADGNGPGAANTLKVMSFNIRYPAAADTGDHAWEKRAPAVSKMLNTIRPDVVGLQEPRTVQREYLMNNHREYALMSVPGTGGTGTISGGNTSLMYRIDRFTLLESGYFFLSYTPDQDSRCFDVGDATRRTSIWVHLREKDTGKEFYFMSTHLPVRTNSSYDNQPYIEARKMSSELNVQRFKAIAGEKAMCFIVGDMNCSPWLVDGSPNPDGVAALAPYNAWMQSARSFDLQKNKASFNGFGGGAAPSPARNLDHIFYRNATGLQFETIDTNFGVPYISDHYPILFTTSF